VIFLGKSGYEGFSGAPFCLVRVSFLLRPSFSLASFFLLIVNGRVVGIATCNALRFLDTRNTLERSFVPFHCSSCSGYPCKVTVFVALIAVVEFDFFHRLLRLMA
jgi:hypothetical protein